MTSPVSIATFAVPLSGNKGSASMLLGLRDAFRASAIDARFNVYSYYPERDAKAAAGMADVEVYPGHPKHLAFALVPLIFLWKIAPGLVTGRWRRAIETLARADVVLLVGGTTFADSMLYKVPWNVLAALPGYLLRRPTVFLSQTVGPLENALNRIAAKWTFSRSVAAHGRGRVSAKWLEGIDAPNVRYWPDLSFSLEVPTFEDVAARLPVGKALGDRMREAGGPIIGVAPNSIVYAKAKRVGIDYVGFLIAVIGVLEEKGCLPVLIPHSYRGDTSKVHNNDRSLCHSIIRGLGQDTKCIYVDADMTSNDLRAIIGRLDVLVASRFHSMISALAMGVPPITFGWGDHKYTEVLDEFEMSDYYRSYRDMRIEEFETLFDRVRAQRSELTRRIETRRATVTETAGGVAAEILRLVGIDAGAAEPVRGTGTR